MSKRDRFSDFVREFFGDVRKHVVEESWFGRSITSDVKESNQTAVAGLSFAEQLGWQRPSGRDGPVPQQDHGIDH